MLPRQEVSWVYHLPKCFSEQKFRIVYSVSCTIFSDITAMNAVEVEQNCVNNKYTLHFFFFFNIMFVENLLITPVHFVHLLDKSPLK